MLTADFRFRRLDRGVNAAHGTFQIVQTALTVAHHPLPVPLIDVHRVDWRQAVFIRAQRLHMGIQAFAGTEIVAAQGFAFPFRQ